MNVYKIYFLISQWLEMDLFGGYIMIFDIAQGLMGFVRVLGNGM